MRREGIAGTMTPGFDPEIDATSFTLERTKAHLMEVDASFRANLNWNYGERSNRVWGLYERNKSAQWNAAADIDWNYDINFGSPMEYARGSGVALFVVENDSPVPRELLNQFRWEYQSWMVSQFLHGEQGALVTTARLVETVPDMESKIYAASQVGDEARHVEAYARYVDEKLGDSYPINTGLKRLLGELLRESRWDILYLGMQVVVEGLALAATRLASTGFGDPIIKQITRMIARDEARHVGFGAVALAGIYEESTSAELKEREDFLLESIHLMSRRFLLREVWERLDLDVERGMEFAMNDPMMFEYRKLLFQQVIHLLRQLNLLTPKLRDLFLSERLAKPEAFRAMT